MGGTGLADMEGDRYSPKRYEALGRGGRGWGGCAGGAAADSATVSEIPLVGDGVDFGGRSSGGETAQRERGGGEPITNWLLEGQGRVSGRNERKEEMERWNSENNYTR